MFDEVETTRSLCNSVKHHWTLVPTNLTSHGSTGWHLSSIPSVYWGNRFWSQKTGCRVAELTWLVCIGNTIVVSWSLQRLSLLANLVMVSDSLVARCFPDSCCSEDFIMALKMVKGWLKLLFKIRVILWELDVTRQTCLTQWLCENSWTSWSLKLPQDSLHPWLQIAHGPILSISPC